MKLSTRARYALRAMAALARLSDGNKPVCLERIARETGISKRYLEQLALALKSAALIEGVSGRQGGYRLGRPARGIRLTEIVEAGIGPINVVKCVRIPQTCQQADACACRLVYATINQSVRQALNKTTLADMIDPAWMEKTRRSMTRQLADDALPDGRPREGRKA